MSLTSISTELPSEVADFLCEVARKRGQTVSDFLPDAIREHLSADEGESWRQAFGAAAIADFEAEFGAITPEELDAARRFWRE